MKRVVTFLLLCVMVFVPIKVFAVENLSVTLNQITMPELFYSSTWDNLVMDFTLSLDESDTLGTFVIKNESLAGPQAEIVELTLYSDAGEEGFQGFAVDTVVATGSYDYNNYNWVFSNIGWYMNSGAHRFFVTVETKRGGTNNRGFQFEILEANDADGDGEYDLDDSGIFFNSGTVLPTETLINEESSLYRSQTADIHDPVGVITNLDDGDIITDASYRIEGQAKDQGGSVPELVSVCIDGSCYDATNTGQNWDSWEFLWAGLSAGDYTLFLKTKDFNGNIAQTDSIAVTVDIDENAVDYEDVSYANSIVSVSSFEAVADGKDYIEVSVVLKDHSTNIVTNQIVFLNEVRDDGPVVIGSGTTDNYGRVKFNVRTEVAGIVALSVSTGEGIGVQGSFNVTFTENQVDYTDGTFIKLPDQSAVYFLDNDDVRHAYPTQAIWESYFEDDFSFVEVINPTKMAGYSLGRNVPFKSGTLMKIPSVPKVYMIGNNGNMEWVKTEAKAIELYGSSWASLVRDLPESFFLDYSEVGTLE
jgi:hypothetical protein